MNPLRLVAFDYRANQETLHALLPPQTLAPAAVQIFAHIVALHEFWLARVIGEPPAEVWPEWPRGQIALLPRQRGCEPPATTDFMPLSCLDPQAIRVTTSTK